MLAVIKSRRPAYEVLVERKAAEVAEHLASALGAFAAAGAARVLGVKARRDAQKGELHSPSIVIIAHTTPAACCLSHRPAFTAVPPPLPPPDPLQAWG